MQGGFERNMPKKGLVVVCYERGVTCPAKLSDSFKSNRLAHFLQATVIEHIGYTRDTGRSGSQFLLIVYFRN